MAQSVIIISGGIDLSIGAKMVFANCLSAMWMEDKGFAACVALAVAVIVITAALSTLTGVIITLSGVPDIIVTLAASFMLSGLALFIIGGPGGGTSPDFQRVVAGDLDNFWPSVLWMLGAVVLLSIPLRLSRQGLAIYAIGSDRKAAFLSGVSVARTRVVAYAVGGVLAGFAGVVVTASTGGGEPRATIGANATLNSVAAAVLGGVALAGGVGGLAGPVLAALCLSLIPAIMLGLGWDPSNAETARGVIIILVVLVAGLLQSRRRSGVSQELDSGSTTIADEEGHVPSAAESTQVVAAIVEQSARPDWRTRIIENPTLVLCGVVLVLYAVTAWKDDSLLTAPGIRSILLLSCPLAIFAASQTLCMLTGGIDLSIAMTANLAAYVAATQSDRGAFVALSMALGIGLAVGLVNGIAIGVAKVNPLIMTLGMASVLLGIITVGLRGWLSGSTNVLSIVREVGSQPLVGPFPKNLIVWAVVAALLILGLRSSGLGRTIYAVGDNQIACRLAGVRIWQVLLAVYVMSGLLAAVGGLLFSGTTGSVGVDQTNNYLLPSVAATVIGGTSILGGVGGYTGTILGAIVLTLLNRLLLRLDTSEAFKQMLYGAIVLSLAWLYVRLSGQKASDT